MLVPAAPKEHYYSPDPVLRQEVWSQLYIDNAQKLVRTMRRKCRWLSIEEAVSVTHDAFLAAQNYQPKSGDFNPSALITHIAWKKAKSLLRERKAQKRDHLEVVLDTVKPAADTDLGIYHPDPDIGVIKEINFQVLKLPALQKAVAKAMIDDPDSSSSEIAAEITFELGKKPTTDAVDSAKRAVRKKLLPYAKCILKELSK